MTYSQVALIYATITFWVLFAVYAYRKDRCMAKMNEAVLEKIRSGSAEAGVEFHMRKREFDEVKFFIWF